MHIQTEITIYCFQSLVDMLVARGVITDGDAEDVYLAAAGVINQIKTSNDTDHKIKARAVTMLTMMDEDDDDLYDELDEDD